MINRMHIGASALLAFVVTIARTVSEIIFVYCEISSDYIGLSVSTLATEADWRRDSRLLGAILPSILFLIIIAILAAAIYMWWKKKQMNNNKVKNIDVKQAKDNNLNKGTLEVNFLTSAERTQLRKLVN